MASLLARGRARWAVFLARYRPLMVPQWVENRTWHPRLFGKFPPRRAEGPAGVRSTRMGSVAHWQPCRAADSSLLLAFPWKMKKHILLLVLLLAATLASAVAQSRPGNRKPAPRTPGRAAPGSKNAPKPPPIYTPITTPRAGADDDAPAPLAVVGKIKLKKPVLVYYEEAAPGKVVQQLIMSEENLPLLKTLNLEQLMTRREVFVDGLGNRALPGTDVAKFRLLGTSAVAETQRRPAGDGRSFFSRLKVPSSGQLYVVRESAEEYRHFVKGPQKKGALLDFGSNGLPGVDSVRAVYTLRKTAAAERGAGRGETIR